MNWYPQDVHGFEKSEPNKTQTRTVTAHLDLQVVQPTEILLSVAAAQGANVSDEKLTVAVDGKELSHTELESAHGTRLHHSTWVPAGQLIVDYSATITGLSEPATVEPMDRFTYLRPSRYVDSDTMFAVAQAEFAGLSGKQLVDSVTSWVGSQLSYVSGWSRPTDGAVDTYLARQGVCRDYAHLVIALLRALEMPARLASVYAPGLDPMDFHAVAEVLLDGQWQVVDATLLAPRESLVRIATGRDASDTAFLTTIGGEVQVNDMTITAQVSPALPNDDITRLVQLR